MTDLPDAVAIWRSTAEGWKARCELLEAENQRLREQGTTGQVGAALPDDVDAVAYVYSFGDPKLASANRTYARAQIAAGMHPDLVARRIARGGESHEEE